MSNKIPEGIKRDHIIAAIHDIDRNINHSFGESTRYDVLFSGFRYPPKAVIGVAAGKLTEAKFAPHDFKGGLGSKCFRILTACGFTIVNKGTTNPIP